MIRRLLTVATASLLFVGAAHASAIFQNGDFSSSNVANNSALYANGFTSTVVTATGWNFSYGSGIINHSWEGQAASGTVAFLQSFGAATGIWSNPSISQTFNLGATSLEISFQLAQRPSNHESVNVLFDGVALAPTLQPNGAGFTTYTYDLSGLTTSQHTLSFNGVNFSNASDSSLFIDNVSVTARAATVPEPASAALLLTGLGLLGMAKRRRAKRDAA